MKLYYDIGCFLFQVGIDFSVAGFVHYLDKIHEVPSGIDIFCGDRCGIGAFLWVRGHLYCLVVEELIDTAISQASPLDA